MNITNINPQECPYYLLTRTSLAITAAFRKAFANAGVDDIKPAYLGVLMCLWQECGINESLGKLGGMEGMRLAELGRSAGLEPSTMTGLIDRMERDGLVIRRDDPDDRRAQRICITEKGGTVRSAVLTAVGETLQSSFDGISEERLSAFKKVLLEILSNTSRGQA